MGAARDATPDILAQLAAVERAMAALAVRAAEEGFMLVIEHHHDFPQGARQLPEWHPPVSWRPYLERRIYAPVSTGPSLTAV